VSIALFDAPPRVTINKPSVVGGSRVGLLMGVVVNGTELQGLICLEDGEPMLVNASWWSFDFRYDAQTDQFKDKDAQEPDQEG
jgi:hypothetical protein